MSFFRYLRIFQNEYRRDKRVKVLDDINCQVRKKNEKQYRKVLVCDISPSGLGFLERNTDLEIGDEILIKFSHISSEDYSSSGKIVRQDVTYFSHSKSIEKAYFRFGAEFDEVKTELIAWHKNPAETEKQRLFDRIISKLTAKGS